MYWDKGYKAKTWFKVYKVDEFGTPDEEGMPIKPGDRVRLQSVFYPKRILQVHDECVGCLCVTEFFMCY